MARSHGGGAAWNVVVAIAVRGSSPAWRLALLERVRGWEQALEVGVGAGRRGGR